MKYTIFVLIILAFTSCSIDNYDEPNTRIQGGIYDLTTHELIPAQAPNGARVRIFEGNSLQSINVWVGTDGSYTDTRLFDGNYRVIPEGPFITSSTDTARISLPAKEGVDFHVEPYLRINLTDTSLSGTTATITFTVSKSAKWTQGLREYAVLYSTTAGISVNSYAKIQRFSVPAGTEGDVLGKTLTVTITDINNSRPVYVRVAAIVNGTSYYNYSKIMEL